MQKQAARGYLQDGIIIALGAYVRKLASFDRNTLDLIR